MTEDLTSASHPHTAFFASAFFIAPAAAVPGHLCDDNCLYCWGPETD